jgi:hypothetical protein
LVMLALFSSMASAQSTISGVVRDMTGAVMADVRVQARYTNTVDRKPRPISTSPLAFSLRKTGEHPALSDPVKMIGRIPLGLS